MALRALVATLLEMIYQIIEGAPPQKNEGLKAGFSAVAFV